LFLVQPDLTKDLLPCQFLAIKDWPGPGRLLILGRFRLIDSGSVALLLLAGSRFRLARGRPAILPSLYPALSPLPGIRLRTGSFATHPASHSGVSLTMPLAGRYGKGGAKYQRSQHKRAPCIGILAHTKTSLGRLNKAYH